MLRLPGSFLDENTPKPNLDLIRLLKPGSVGALGHLFLELPEGPTLSLSAHRTNLKGESGERLGWLMTFDDISDLEKAQRLAAWREVAKRIAHEIKNPLTPISLAAQRLMRKFGDKIEDTRESQVFEECVSVIIRQVETMRNLVSEFSEFARLPQVNPRPADLKKTVEDSITLFKEAHPKIEFLLDVQSDLEIFAFDQEQMGRVLTNLLTNATYALKDSGRIETRITHDRLVGVEIRISDNGPGLPKEVRQRLFEPYITSTSGGQGLGLSIVKTIVNDHGGFVRVEDNFPKGTVVVITLPYLTVERDAK
jgi:two-component system nitrogen regulation sensor histidine kinase NtrY